MDLPKDKGVVGLKNTNMMAQFKNTKHGWVLKVNMQRQDINFDETFVPVVRFDIYYSNFLGLAAYNKWKVYLFYMKLTFLNDFLDKEIYVQQPKGFEVTGHEGKVKKALYDLKQAP